MAAFVRDPFVTLIQNLSLNLENKARQVLITERILLLGS